MCRTDKPSYTFLTPSFNFNRKVNSMFLSLISGSSGNASIIKNNDTTILIDCGMSGKRLMNMLASIDMSCEDIDAMLITHEHSDHITGAGVISRRFDIPIYATQKTHEVMKIGAMRDELRKIIIPNQDFIIGDIAINSFSISHDAVDPVCYTFICDNIKHSILTDTGIVTDEILSAVSNSEYVMLEANHDIDMLMYGEYPFELKKRILSKKGHLSNDTAGEIAVRLINSNTKNIMLSHLSDKNNSPDVAYNTVAQALRNNGAKIDKDINLLVAKRYEVTSFI